MMRDKIRELDESWERTVIGSQLTNRLLAHLHAEINRNFQKSLNRRMLESVVVAVLDQRGRVEEIGFNKPGDLILDNFGTWLAGFISAVDTASKSVSLTDVTPASRTIYLYSIAPSSAGTIVFTMNPSGFACGTRLQVGSGSTTPTRGDTAITTPFGTAPESGRFDTGEGSYAAGAISFSGAISAGGSGTIRETGFFGVWRDGVGTVREIMLFHDLLAVPKAFTPGQTINVSYSTAL